MSCAASACALAGAPDAPHASYSGRADRRERFMRAGVIRGVVGARGKLHTKAGERTLKRRSMAGETGGSLMRSGE